MAVIKKYWGLLLIICFTMSIGKERQVKTPTYLDKLDNYMKLYLKYILGKSTDQERRMIRKKVKKDAAIVGGAAVAIGGTIVAAKVAGPTVIQKLKKVFKSEKDQQSVLAEGKDIKRASNEKLGASIEPEIEKLVIEKSVYEIVNDIKTMLSNTSRQRRKFTIGKQNIYVITYQENINLIFSESGKKILNNDYDKSLESINTVLVNITRELQNKEQKVCRIFIPADNQFDGKTPFDANVLKYDNFLEYYPKPVEYQQKFAITNNGVTVGKRTQNFAKGITKWDWTQEFYDHRENEDGSKNF